MNIYKLSASNIQTFTVCPFRYKLKYHDRKDEIQPQNEWGKVGSAFHEAVAKYFTDHNDGKPIDLKIFTDLMAEAFSSHGVDLTVYNEWMEIAKQWATRVTPPKEVLGIEVEMDMILPNGVPVIGYLDLVERIDEDTIRIRDWKTGNNPMTDEDLDKNIQAPMYIVGAKRLFKAKNIEFVFDYIKFNEIPYTYTVNDMKKFIKYLKGVFDGIKNTDPKKAESRVGSHCMFCAFQGQCPSMDKARKGKIELSISDPRTFDEYIIALTHIDAMIKGLDVEKKRLRGLITGKMEEDDADSYENDGAKVKMQRNTYTNFNVDQIIKYSKKYPELYPAIDVKKTVIDKALKSVPEEVKDDIESSATTGYSKPFIRVTAKGGKNGKNKKTGNDEFFK
jgi:CRISPR/Cas system-associated exonuclease Cas4 (RecB family)